MKKRNVTQEILGQDGHAGAYYLDREAIGKETRRLTKKRRLNLALNFQPNHALKIKTAIKNRYGSIKEFCKKSLFPEEFVKEVCNFKITERTSSLAIKNLLIYLEINIQEDSHGSPR